MIPFQQADLLTINYEMEEAYKLATTNYNLPTISGNMTADVVRDMNALAEATDTAIKTAVQTASEYPTATVVGSQVRLTGVSGTVVKFRLNTDVTGAVTISLDGGATSKPLRDFEGIQLTELEKGFVEVVADATFFTLRSRGGGIKKEDLQSLITDINSIYDK